MKDPTLNNTLTWNKHSMQLTKVKITWQGCYTKINYDCCPIRIFPNKMGIYNSHSDKIFKTQEKFSFWKDKTQGFKYFPAIVRNRYRNVHTVRTLQHSTCKMNYLFVWTNSNFSRVVVVVVAVVVVEVLVARHLYCNSSAYWKLTIQYYIYIPLVT